MSFNSEPPPTHGHYAFRRSAEQLLKMLDEFKGTHLIPKFIDNGKPLSANNIMSVRQGLQRLESLILDASALEKQEQHFSDLYNIMTLSYYVAIKHSGRRTGIRTAKKQKRVIEKEAKRKIIEDVAKSYLERHPDKAGKLGTIATAIQKDVNLKIAAENASGKISAKGIGARAIYNHLQDTFGLQRPSDPVPG